MTNTYTTTTGARPAIRGGGWTNILQKHSPLSAASLGRTRRQCGVSLASSAQSGHSAPISELAWGLEDGVNFSSNNERPTRIDSANRLLLSPTTHPPSPLPLPVPFREKLGDANVHYYNQNQLSTMPHRGQMRSPCHSLHQLWINFPRKFLPWLPNCAR